MKKFAVVLMLLASGIFPQLAAAQATSTGSGQAYPTRPIEVTVHTGPGGGADVVARLFAEVVQKERLLPQPFVVQNRTGGGGAVAQSYVAAKRGDPYVVLSVAVSVLVSVPIRTGTDVGLDKFQPLAMIGSDLNALTVREDSPYRTVKDLVVGSGLEFEDRGVAEPRDGGAGAGSSRPHKAAIAQGFPC